MKKLNKEATRIFCKLLDRMGIEEYMKLTSDDFMPLVMEQVNAGELIDTPEGKGQLYSLAHYYQQNGDPMGDPEMIFLVVDKRVNAGGYDLVNIYPQYYRQDGLGVYEECIIIENNKVVSYKPTWQSGHCNFANTWLKNIRQQGFLKAI